MESPPRAPTSTVLWTMPSNPAPLLQGTLDLIVLQLLRSEPTNGSDLSLRIQAISRDVLEERGLIEAEWHDTPKGRRAKVYSLTADGRKALAEQREAWTRFSGALAAILKTT